MSSTAIKKICRLCNKDVSSTKRIKDAQGHYYCEPCHHAAVQRGPAPTAAPAPAPRPADDGEYDLLPSTESAPKRPAPTVKPPVATAPAARPAATPAPASSKMPDFCPNCDAPVIKNRKLCLRCHRDVTQMDKLLAMKAEAEKTSTSEVAANWIGRIVKGALILLVLGIVVFLGIGAWLMFHPAGAFDDYPTTREAAIRQFLEDVALGTDKGYNDAFLLISFRERQTNNTHEDLLYKMVYTHMHDDFQKKYGADWPSKAKIESADPGNTEEVVPYLVTINGDSYHVSTQVQISVEQAIANMTVRREVPHYPENGKRHFGVLEVEEYTVHPRSTMLEHAGPGKPEPLPPFQNGN